MSCCETKACKTGRAKIELKQNANYIAEFKFEDIDLSSYDAFLDIKENLDSEEIAYQASTLNSDITKSYDSETNITTFTVNISKDNVNLIISRLPDFQGYSDLLLTSADINLYPLSFFVVCEETISRNL